MLCNKFSVRLVSFIELLQCMLPECCSEAKGIFLFINLNKTSVSHAASQSLDIFSFWKNGKNMLHE